MASERRTLNADELAQCEKALEARLVDLDEAMRIETSGEDEFNRLIAMRLNTKCALNIVCLQRTLRANRFVATTLDSNPETKKDQLI